ncbi:MAG TPA: hypothetical protein VGQ32_03115 [Thermoanaerobaculia bacterium]|jgi:hypothetical protein|nr:hypothetical protein [Thermoanaerobaculia bacterium]
MRWRPALVIAGLGLAVVGRWMSFGRPHRAPDLAIVAFFLLPFVLLAIWAFTQDTRGTGPLRGLRAALFAFLVVEAFYWGISLGGIAAAAGAIAVFTRLIRPRSRTVPE